MIKPPKKVSVSGCFDMLHSGRLLFRRRDSFESQVALFRQMSSPAIETVLAECAPLALGWELSGAGSGGYMVLATEHSLAGAMKLTIRRKAS